MAKVKINVAQDQYLRNNIGKLDNKTLSEHTGLSIKTISSFVKNLATVKESEPTKTVTGPPKAKEVSTIGKSKLKYNDGTVVMTEKQSRIDDQQYLQNLPSDNDLIKRYGKDIDTTFMERTPIPEESEETEDLYQDIQQGKFSNK